MPKLTQRLQDIGFRYGSGLMPEDIDYSEHVSDGWSIGQSSEYNLIVVIHHSGVLTIDAEIIGNSQMFWDATKKLIADELATVTSKQLSLF